MATARKKAPSSAQLAARKTFAEMAKAGTLRKIARKKPAAKRASNPLAKRSISNTRARKSSSAPTTVATWGDHYIVQEASSEGGKYSFVGLAKELAIAKSIARSYSHANPDRWVRVVSKEG